MYEEYYKWEERQMIKQTQKTGKKDDCAIYWVFFEDNESDWGHLRVKQHDF